MSTARSEDTLPIGARALSGLGGELGLWRLFQAGTPCGTLAASLSRVALLNIGRDAGCNLVLDDPTVSRSHCRISLAAAGVPGVGPWNIEDLGARNGTWVGTHRLEPGTTARVQVGDSVRVGNSLFWLGYGAVGAGDPRERLFPGFSELTAAVALRIKQLYAAGAPIVFCGEPGSGRRLMLGKLLASLANTPSPLIVVSPQDVGTWEAALTQAPANVSVNLICGPLEAMSAAVQQWLARELAIQSVQRAKGIAHDWQFLGWSDQVDPARESAAGRLLPALARELRRSTVSVPALTDHVEDVVCIIEHLREAFGLRTLTSLASESTELAAQTCTEVQSWLRQGWAGGLSELIAFALPAEVQALVQNNGLSGELGPWRRNPSLASVLDQAPRSSRPDSDLVVSVPEVTRAPVAPTQHRASGVHEAKTNDSGAFRANAGQTGHRMRHLSGAIAPFDAGLVQAWQGNTTIRDAQWFAIAMSQSEFLREAIDTGFHGNVRSFCLDASGKLEQNPDSVRRQVYRVLGGALNSLRK